ncbi:MAG: aromatic ring-hydroxylating oxygenase subunit alpha [bacterium]
MKTNLEPEYYISPSIFSTERSGLFSNTWQLIGPLSRLSQAGSYVSDDIAGIKILVLRGRDGVLRAFRNACRHRGAQLIEDGTGVCRSIRCPYHNWVYDDNGMLTHAPWFGEDSEFDLDQWPLQPIHIQTWRSLVFVSIDPEQSLLEQLGRCDAALSDVPVDKYQLADEQRMEFSANWKVYTDNFVEGYHIPGIHPAFFAAIDFEKFHTDAADGLVTMTAPAKKDLFYKGRWYWMWPNWTLSLFEGGMNTSRINPLSHDRTELIYHFYFAELEEADSNVRAETIRRNLEVVHQDFEICAETHHNYNTGNYTPGPLSPKHERGVMYFQERYRSKVNSAR